MRIFALASAFIALVGAAPYDGPRLTKRAVTPAVFNSIELFQEYSAAAYKRTNFQPLSYGPGNSKPLLCNAESCPTLTASQNKPTIVYSGNMPTMAFSIFNLPNPFVASTGFYVARDTNHSAIIVAFQGTDFTGGLANIVSGLSQGRTDILGSLVATAFNGPSCTGCQVAKSFQDTYDAVSAGIINAVQSELANSSQSNFSVVFTGHSLGGALAGIAAAEARAKNTFIGKKVDLYSYASPRIGNNQFAVAVSNQKSFNSSTFRVTHNGDPVPRVPLLFPISLVPFSLGATADHYGPEYYIATPFNQLVTPADINTFAATPQNGMIVESTSGNLGSTPTADPLGHNFYIHPITCPNC